MLTIILKSLDLDSLNIPSSVYRSKNKKNKKRKKCKIKKERNLREEEAITRKKRE